MYDRKSNIFLLHPQLTLAVECLLRDMTACHESFAVFETWRRPQDQRLLFEAKKSRADSWFSWHQYGLAVDIVYCKEVGTKKYWSWDKVHPWSLLGMTGKKYGLEWGGDFKYPDLVHFQLPCKMDTRLARNIVIAEGILGLWDTIK